MERKKILYGDDDIANRELVSLLLEEKIPEADIELHNSGLSVEKRLMSGLKDFDLVLLDNTMPPGPKGSELIKRYAKSPGYEKPFILYFAGFEEVGEQAIRDGAFAYVSKNGKSNDLISTIRSALKIE